MNRTMKSVIDDLRNKNIQERKAHGKWVPENGELFATYKESFFNLLQNLQEAKTVAPVKTVKDILISGNSRIIRALSGQSSVESMEGTYTKKLQDLTQGIEVIKDSDAATADEIKELEDIRKKFEAMIQSNPGGPEIRDYFNQEIRPRLGKMDFSAKYVYATLRKNQASSSSSYTSGKHPTNKGEFGFAFTILGMGDSFQNELYMQAKLFKNMLAIEGHSLSLSTGDEDKFYVNFFANCFALIDTLGVLIESTKDEEGNTFVQVINSCIKAFDTTLLAVPALIAAPLDILVAPDEIGGRREALTRFKTFLNTFPSRWVAESNSRLAPGGKQFTSLVSKSDVRKDDKYKDLIPIKEEDLPCYVAFLRYTFDLYLYQCGYADNLRDVFYGIKNYPKETLVKILLTFNFEGFWGANKFLGSKDNTTIPRAAAGEKNTLTDASSETDSDRETDIEANTKSGTESNAKSNTEDSFPNLSSMKYDKSGKYDNNSGRAEAAAPQKGQVTLTPEIRSMPLFSIGNNISREA